MSRTLVVQSHRSPLPWPWLEACLESVRRWCTANRYEYRFIGDDLFDYVPAGLLKRTQGQPVIATDLARLHVLREALKGDYERVVWMDADFLVFNPSAFTLPVDACALGREVWVQTDEQGKLRVHKKVHNAFLMFRQGNSFLDFYADTAERLLAENRGTVPPQFIGPKLLTALHNVAGLPVLETAGMFSPLVIRDVLAGQGPALDLFTRHSVQPVTAANLCISSCERGEISAAEMQRFADILLDRAAVTPV
jgi:hypothetical protein